MTSSRPGSRAGSMTTQTQAYAFESEEQGDMAYVLNQIDDITSSPGGYSQEAVTWNWGPPDSISGVDTLLFVGRVGGWLMEIWKKQRYHLRPKSPRVAHLAIEGLSSMPSKAQLAALKKNQLNNVLPCGVPKDKTVWLITGPIDSDSAEILGYIFQAIYEVSNSQLAHIQITSQWKQGASRTPYGVATRWSINDDSIRMHLWPSYGPRYHPDMWGHGIAALWANYKSIHTSFERTRRSLLSGSSSAPPSRQGTPQPGQRTQQTSVRPQARAAVQTHIINEARTKSGKPPLPPRGTPSSSRGPGGQLGRSSSGGRVASTGEVQRPGSIGGGSSGTTRR